MKILWNLINMKKKTQRDVKDSLTQNTVDNKSEKSHTVSHFDKEKKYVSCHSGQVRTPLSACSRPTACMTLSFLQEHAPLFVPQRNYLCSIFDMLLRIETGKEWLYNVLQT